jgi:hypothetical protein
MTWPRNTAASKFLMATNQPSNVLPHVQTKAPSILSSTRTRSSIRLTPANVRAQRCHPFDNAEYMSMMVQNRILKCVVMVSLHNYKLKTVCNSPMWYTQV